MSKINFSSLVEIPEIPIGSSILLGIGTMNYKLPSQVLLDLIGSASGSAVESDITLTGDGTLLDPLKVATPFPGFTSLTVDYGVTLATVATTGAYSDLTGTPDDPTLTSVLTTGNTTADGQVLRALNGGGQLNLRNSVDGVVSLTTDYGVEGESGLYLTKTDAALFSDAWNRGFIVGGVGIEMWNQDSVEANRSIKVQVGLSNPIFLHDNTSADRSSPVGNNFATFLGTANSTIKIGVVNSVVIAGASQIAKTSNTAYVPQLGFFKSGTIEGLLRSETLTEDRTWDLPNGSGILALTSDIVNQTESLVVAASDETTELTTGTNKITFRMPYGFTLSDIRASVASAPTGSILTVDVNEGGVSILSTKITIDATEKTSTTAVAPPVISDSILANDAEITVDIDTIGSTFGGAGLKITLIGTRI